MNKLFKNFVQDESGQDLIEYALLAGFISLVAVVAITNVGHRCECRVWQHRHTGSGDSCSVVSLVLGFTAGRLA